MLFRSALNGIVEILASILTGVSITFFGIKPPFILSFAISGIFMFMVQFVSTSITLTSTFVALGKFGVSACFNFIYIIVGMTFPSRIKNTALGICIFVDRIGSIVGPIFGLNQTLFQTVSALFCTICIIVVIRFPINDNSKRSLSSPEQT